MLERCGNYAAIYTNYDSFYTKNASAIRQRTYIVGVKTWIIKNIGTLHTFGFLQISAGISALSKIRMLAELAPSKCQWHRVHQLVLCCWRSWKRWYLHARGTGAVLAWYATWPHPFLGKILYYASVMPRFKSYWLCSKLRWHNILKPNPNHTFVLDDNWSLYFHAWRFCYMTSRIYLPSALIPCPYLHP